MKNHDLHTHTTFSDGSLEPEKLIELAIEKKIEVKRIMNNFFLFKF
ncbi:hypothetical protein HOK51_08145 [Candidatus Woesearchaeota archaeon]|jgi:predicted metal-dependent phosphoesterase TrpH|nr:hypothetical protein [Candidatus Woesearchaeota archaeon]MBT6519795.1 hypothetical protein [Candidatus Woesearchaeota archaeon]MBT7368174.1 hypothetical protein [Candidatus Woesearchaeota archaeon]